MLTLLGRWWTFVPPMFRVLRFFKSLLVHKNRSRQLPILGDSEWHAICARWPLFARLPPDYAEQLRSMASRFLGSKYLEGVRGFKLTAQSEWAIALFACLPIAKLGLDWYRDWNNIFVCPRAFTDTRRQYGKDGVVTESEDELSGEVLELGPVVLSWEDVCDAGQGRGYNVVIHEMAHKLDALNGEMDGTPPLPSESRAEWRRAFSEAYQDFCMQVQRASHGRAATERQRLARLPMDDYAAESPEEFFAVVCEVFFERPLRLKREWPDLFACLTNFFKCDPATWI